MTQKIDVPTEEPTLAAVNPLLARARIPGETFRLPSCGILYDDGELDGDVKNGEVHVYPMTAIDEIIMTSPDKIFSGDGIVEVIGRCAPSVLKPKRLFTQDIDFLILCLRKVSYGPMFEFKKAHIGCQAFLDNDELTVEPSHTYSTNTEVLINATKLINPSSVATEYNKTLTNGQSIVIEPMRFENYIEFIHANSNTEVNGLEPEDQKNMILGQLCNLIKSVDEITDIAMIREWLEILTPKDLAEINTYISKFAEWGVDTGIAVECADCGEEMEVEIPTNPLVIFS